MHVAQLATLVNPNVARSFNDLPSAARLNEAMPTVSRIYPGKQLRRPHHIAEWAELRGLRQADIALEIGADKGLVSRWFSGSTPLPDWQMKLAALFACEPEDLFRHPDEDWVSRFLRGRAPDEIGRIKATLEAAFPRRDDSPPANPHTPARKRA